MELINLSDYDLSYEKQFMTLMVRLLRPYIIFKKPLAPDPSTNRGKPIHGTLNIYWVGDPLLPQPHTWPTNPRFTAIRFGGRPEAKDRNHDADLEIISFEEYVHFIQCIFPTIIQDEIRTNQSELDFLEIKQEILKQPHPKQALGRHAAACYTGPRFILPRFMSGDEHLEKANELIQELNQFNKQDIDEEFKQTNRKFQKLVAKNKYLTNVEKINREKNGSINKIIYFLINLDYLGIKTTQERPWTQIPSPAKFDSFG